MIQKPCQEWLRRDGDKDTWIGEKIDERRSDVSSEGS